MEHWDKIANTLDLKIGQKFTIDNNKNEMYKFTDDGLVKWNCEEEKWKQDPEMLLSLLYGEETVKRVQPLKFSHEGRNCLRKLVGKDDLICLVRTKDDEGGDCLYTKVLANNIVRWNHVWMKYHDLYTNMKEDKEYYPWEVKY